jgi:hypothetical protein
VKSPGRRILRALALTICVFMLRTASALDWICIAPNPAYTRDFSMGASTVALAYAPQSQSINPAGLTLFDRRTAARATLLVNPGGLWQARNYLRHASDTYNGRDVAEDAARLMLSGGAVQLRFFTLAALISQPVMLSGDIRRYRDYDKDTFFSAHQNSLLGVVSLHPRVSVGGRVDQYYSFDHPEGEGYSYGVILRPRGVSIGVQYQRFPASGVRVFHPLDRRSDQTTTAGLAVARENFTVSVQVQNLTENDRPAFLEPHAGIEWRPVRALALRAGGVQFSRSNRWAWTAGFGLFDANWLRPKSARLAAPDEMFQFGLGMVYRKRMPVLGIGTATLAVRL